MSVRVCYMHRTCRGAALASLRLVGQGTEVSWRAPAGDADAYDAAADWLVEQLKSTRSADVLTMLCLDVDGSLCSWITASNSDEDVINAVARRDENPVGNEDDAASDRNVATPVSYFAGEESESSIQALVEPVVRKRSSILPMRTSSALAGANGKAGGSASKRVSILTVWDVPARLLVDALDARGISVERTSSIWHALAGAWDRPVAVAASPRVCATVALVPDLGEGHRLVWAWSLEGQLLCGGSMRVGMARPAEEAEASDGSMVMNEAPRLAMVGAPEVGRLVSEWLSWSAQLSVAPERITVLFPSLGVDERGVPLSAAFAQSLTAAWGGATVELVTDPDPLGATLRALAEVLDSTPLVEGTARSSLLAVTRRPGRQHRKMYVWLSMALFAAAGTLGVFAWRLHSEATLKKEASFAWQLKWREVVQEYYPRALEPTLPGEPPKAAPIEQIRTEVAKLQEARKPADTGEATMPILQELDGLSYLLANPDFEIESIKLDSARDVKIAISLNSLTEAEELASALNQMAGLRTVRWEAKFPSRANAGTPAAQKIKMLYTGQWDPALRSNARGGS